MHQTAMLKFQAMCEVHLAGSVPGRVLEVGSKTYGSDSGFRTLMPNGWRYTGLDIADGDNVDLVPTHPYVWREVATGSYDCCVTAQTFEHNPFFWLTFAEMARVTRPGGLIFAIAPGRGPVHRYPFDCWRFYPDSWPALASYVGLELLESNFEEPSVSTVESGAEWCDCMGIFRRPILEPEAEARLLARLDLIAKTAEPFKTTDLETCAEGGAVIGRYRTLLRRSPGYVVYRRLRKLGNLRRLVQRVFVDP